MTWTSDKILLCGLIVFFTAVWSLVFKFQMQEAGTAVLQIVLTLIGALIGIIKGAFNARKDS